MHLEANKHQMRGLSKNKNPLTRGSSDFYPRNLQFFAVFQKLKPPKSLFSNVFFISSAISYSAVFQIKSLKCEVCDVRKILHHFFTFKNLLRREIHSSFFKSKSQKTDN